MKQYGLSDVSPVSLVKPVSHEDKDDEEEDEGEPADAGERGADEPRDGEGQKHAYQRQGPVVHLESGPRKGKHLFTIIYRVSGQMCKVCSLVLGIIIC